MDEPMSVFYDLFSLQFITTTCFNHKGKRANAKTICHSIKGVSKG